MTEDEIRNLLQQADRMAGQPARKDVDVSTIRRRVRHRHLAGVIGPIAAAAMLIVALSTWRPPARAPEPTREQRKIVALEAQVKQLQTSTDAALALIRDVLDEERRLSRLNALEAQLAAIPDPLEEIQKQVDKTAFILVYQADRLYRELNETESAVETYQRVIELFPRNQWATVARQRLSEIKNRKTDKENS